MTESISLFETAEQSMLETGGRLEVVEGSFVAAHSKSWQDLFSGFDRLYAVTYSAGIGFIHQLLQKFSYAEVIFGCEAVMSYGVAEVMAFQAADLERLRKDGKVYNYLTGRIGDGSLRLFSAKEKLSHEKIYLLEADDGRRRVVMGSANMSHTAFAGTQRENICYFDDDAAFEWYMVCFRGLLEYSTVDISREALAFGDNAENIDKLPIAQHVRVEKAMIVEPKTEPDVHDKIKYVLDLRTNAKKLEPLIPKEKKGGKTTLSADKITSIKRKAVEQNKEEKAAREEYPQLLIDTETKTASLNGVELDLLPTHAEIKKDIKIFLEYMGGFDSFHSDTATMQRRYFEFAVWFFATPFLATLRNIAHKNNKKIDLYPIFGLVYGKSKGGKSSFPETLLKMMVGQTVKIPGKSFTRNRIDELRKQVKGVPIIVDDIVSKRFNDYAPEAIKCDDYGLSDNNIHYPAVVISANEDVKVINPELVRRTVVFHVKGGLKNLEVMKNNIVERTRKHIGTAFYREYLRQMLERMPKMLSRLKNTDEDDLPDIFTLSSIVIRGIIQDHSINLPQYVRKLTIKDYFDEKITGVVVIKAIRTAWETDKAAFKISHNQLRYKAGDLNEANRILKMLPEDLEAESSKEWVIMRYDTAVKFFDLDFRKNWLERIRG